MDNGRLSGLVRFSSLYRHRPPPPTRVAKPHHRSRQRLECHHGAIDQQTVIGRPLRRVAPMTLRPRSKPSRNQSALRAVPVTRTCAICDYRISIIAILTSRPRLTYGLRPVRSIRVDRAKRLAVERRIERHLPPCRCRTISLLHLPGLHYALVTGRTAGKPFADARGDVARDKSTLFPCQDTAPPGRSAEGFLFSGDRYGPDDEQI